MSFLGHIVSSEGVKPTTTNVQAIVDYQKPRTKKQLRRFLGMIQFYNRFIPNFAKIFGPLYSLTSTENRASRISWTPDTDKCFARAILQLNIEGLTASKMNVLHHLAMQSEALVILLQETHCTDAEKLVLPNYQLAGSSLSRKHGLATFVHKRLRYTLLDQSLPTSEIEWLCVDVDIYKIVNAYKTPPTRLRTLDLPVFPHACLYAGDFNCRHADWGYDDNSPDGECLAGWASIKCLALLYNAKDAASFYSGRWNTGTNLDLAFASVSPNSRLPDAIFNFVPKEL